MITDKQLKELKTGDEVVLKLEKQIDQFPNATFGKIIDDKYVLIKSGGAGQKIKTSLFQKYGVIPAAKDEPKETETAKDEEPKKESKKKKK